MCDVHRFEVGLRHFQISVFSKIIVHAFSLKVFTTKLFMCFSLFPMRVLSLSSVSHLCFNLNVQKILREQCNLQKCLWWNYINFPRSFLVTTNSSRYFFPPSYNIKRNYINRNIYFANLEINYLPIFPEIYPL